MSDTTQTFSGDTGYTRHSKVDETSVLLSVTSYEGVVKLVNYWSENLPEAQRWDVARFMLMFPPTGISSDGRGAALLEGGSQITFPIKCCPGSDRYSKETGKSPTTIEKRVSQKPEEFGPLLLQLLHSISDERNTFKGMACNLTWSIPPNPLRNYMKHKTQHLFAQPLWLIEVMRDGSPAGLYNTALVLHTWVVRTLCDRSSEFYSLLESGLVCPLPAVYHACKKVLTDMASYIVEDTNGRISSDEIINTCYIQSQEGRIYSKVYDMTIAFVYVVLDKSSPQDTAVSINWDMFKSVFPIATQEMVMLLVKSEHKPVEILRRGA